MDPMKKHEERSMLQVIVLTAISLVIGAMLVIWPNTSEKIIAYTLAGLITAAGILHVVMELTKHRPFMPFPGLATGLTVFSIGVFLLIRIDILIGLLQLVLGVFLIYLGFSMAEKSLLFRKGMLPLWWLPAIFGVVSVVLGFLSIFDVFGNSAMRFLGISLIVEAVLQIVALFLFKGKAPTPPQPGMPPVPPTPGAGVPGPQKVQ